MIVGNPFSFSIGWEVIDEWNIDDTFLNGVLYFSISEMIFPQTIISSTLKSELPKLKSSLINIKTDKEIFSLSKQVAFKKMYDITYPEGDNDNMFYHMVTPQSLIDNDYFLFAVKMDNKTRFLSSHLEYIVEKRAYSFENIDIAEAIIDDAQLVRIIQALPDTI